MQTVVLFVPLAPYIFLLFYIYYHIFVQYILQHWFNVQLCLLTKCMINLVFPSYIKMKSLFSHEIYFQFCITWKYGPGQNLKHLSFLESIFISFHYRSSTELTLVVGWNCIQCMQHDTTGTLPSTNWIIHGVTGGTNNIACRPAEY